MTVKSIITSALFIIFILILIAIGTELRDRAEETKFKVFHSQVEE